MFVQQLSVQPGQGGKDRRVLQAQLEAQQCVVCTAEDGNAIQYVVILTFVR